MYDHAKQYRCDIIRGKSQKEMDDLLPAYAKVIDEICPCRHEDFEHLFNDRFARYIPESQHVKKTFDNHRTEIAGKLFGMYYFAVDGMVYESQRTLKFLEDNDQPAFFKDVCFKMQFPNGMQKPKPTVIERVNDGICIRPNAFVLKLLLIAKTANIDITQKTIAYYVLNSYDVLSGSATPYEVLDVIAEDQHNKIVRSINASDSNGNEKAHSFKYQHIKEQLNYLELANLIRYTDNPLNHHDKCIVLNPNEMSTIAVFAADWNKKPEFDVASYDLSTVEKRKNFQYEWDLYFSQLSSHAGDFLTTVDALITNSNPQNQNGEQDTNKRNLTQFGNEGEELVFNYEKQRVYEYNPRLANKVLSLGKTRGLGYDIQSVIAEKGNMEEFVKYIEVKSTKRLTVPDIEDSLWVDTLSITRNEWVAAQQHGAFYSIFRVYFTRDGVKIFVLTNIAEKYNNGLLQATPMTYRVDFSNNSVDCIIDL